MSQVYTNRAVVNIETPWAYDTSTDRYQPTNEPSATPMVASVATASEK